MEFYPLKPDIQSADTFREEFLMKLLHNKGFTCKLNNSLFEPDHFAFNYIPNPPPQTEKYLHVPRTLLGEFRAKFSNYISQENFVYDNLIKLLIMVKNGGDSFRSVLEQNLPFIDCWSILDTGSTDDTVEIIRKTMDKKDGNLYQEPFLNFRDSRNRLIDLSKTDGRDCVFNIFLDDTFIIQDGTDMKIRNFLHMFRTDNQADSFSLYISEADMHYSTNRVLRSEKNLKYIYRVHEIIEPNQNMLIPQKYGYIKGVTTEYMQTRTETRKRTDLQMLLEDYQEKPDGRLAYYIAETYLNLEDWKNAVIWYKTRLTFVAKIFEEETYDALYKTAVLSQGNLGAEWSEIIELYFACYEQCQKRPEALYMIGTHYKNKGFVNVAKLFLEKAWDVSFPEKYGLNMNLKMDLYNIHLPKELLEIYMHSRSISDLNSAVNMINHIEKYASTLVQSGSPDLDMLRMRVFITIPQYKEIIKLYQNVTKKPFLQDRIKVTDKKVIVFATKGGWSNWDGETMYTKGLGGSETTMVRYAEHLAKKYKVFFFCPCETKIVKTDSETKFFTKSYNGVDYLNYENYSDFISVVKVDYALINRYPEFLPITYDQQIPCYFMVHDLLRAGEVFIDSPFLRGILCPSDWCKQYISEQLPHFAPKVSLFYYGTDRYLEEKPVENKHENPYFPPTKDYIITKPIKYLHSFIYPSFPNRGLLILLQLWPRILKEFPTATLSVFCDFENTWTKQHWSEEMEEIKKLLVVYRDSVVNHGWVSKYKLEKQWLNSGVWFYPCKFIETSCQTALEAQLYQNLVICPSMAGLTETAKMGELIEGDPTTTEWQNQALEKLFDYMKNPSKREKKVLDAYWYVVNNKNYKKLVDQFEKDYLV